jgi:formamidopyrimidine-DNA glycosylase
VPELPEVETVRRDLEGEFTGKRVKRVEVTGLRSVRRHPTNEDFIARVEGRTINGVRRRGKFLLVDLDDGHVLVAHLRMSGQLLRADAADAIPKHAHVVITFNDGQQLRFVDPRTFGELFVASADVPELAHFGPDPLDPVLDEIHFGRMLAPRRTNVKPLLMDQRFLAGIGNIYSDEMLWSARIRHDRSANSLSVEEVNRLYRAMVDTLQAAIIHRGSSLADAQYRDLFGAVGDYQRHHQVYDREGRSCPRCGTTIVRVKANGRSTFFCTKCQTGSAAAAEGAANVRFACS